jgi:hypothetical protein
VRFPRSAKRVRPAGPDAPPLRHVTRRPQVSATFHSCKTLTRIRACTDPRAGYSTANRAISLVILPQTRGIICSFAFLYFPPSDTIVYRSVWLPLPSATPSGSVTLHSTGLPQVHSAAQPSQHSARLSGCFILAVSISMTTFSPSPLNGLHQQTGLPATLIASRWNLNGSPSLKTAFAGRILILTPSVGGPNAVGGATSESLKSLNAVTVSIPESVSTLRTIWVTGGANRLCLRKRPVMATPVPGRSSSCAISSAVARSEKRTA